MALEPGLSTDAARRLDEAIQTIGDYGPPTLSSNIPVECWTYSALAGDVPDVLRMLADRLEERGQALLGLQSTGFGQEHEAIIQVFVDPDRESETT